MDVGFVGIDSDPLDAYVWGSSPPMSMRELLVTGGDVEKLHLYRWWRACLENTKGRENTFPRRPGPEHPERFATY